MFNSLKVGYRIMLLRKKKGYTQEELAEKLEVSAQAISKWENGHCMPETSLLPLLSEILNTSIDSILIPPICSDIIKNIEEIRNIEKSEIKMVFDKIIDKKAIIIAAKCVSPATHKYLEEIFPEIDFKREHEKMGAIRIDDVEKIHSYMIELINARV